MSLVPHLTHLAQQSLNGAEPSRLIHVAGRDEIRKYNRITLPLSSSSTPSASKTLDFGNKRKMNSRRSILIDLDGNDDLCSSPSARQRLSPINPVRD